MKYVVHRRFKDKAICGEVNLPAMTMCKETNGYIFYGDKLLCVATSENAHQFFARDDDDAGMLRGKLTQAIQKRSQSVMRIIKIDGTRSGKTQPANRISASNMQTSGCGTMISSTPILIRSDTSQSW